jgi:hypothetical protein
MSPFYRVPPGFVGAVCDREAMDELLMLRGVTGRCPDCEDERVMLPADDDGFEFCCTDCDAAVLLVELVVADPSLLERRAG